MVEVLGDAKDLSRLYIVTEDWHRLNIGKHHPKFTVQHFYHQLFDAYAKTSQLNQLSIIYKDMKAHNVKSSLRHWLVIQKLLADGEPFRKAACEQIEKTLKEKGNRDLTETEEERFEKSIGFAEQLMNEAPNKYVDE